MTYLLVTLALCGVIGAILLNRFGRTLTGAILGLILGPVGVFIAVLMFVTLKAEAQQKAHDMRLKAMLRATMKPGMSAEQAMAMLGGRSPAAEPTAPAIPRKERECPFCAELILEKARICKHCGREVEPLG